MLAIEFLSLSANTYLDLGLARNPNIQSLPRTPNLLGTMHKISLDTTGVMAERVQRVHFHPSIFANGCIAPVLIDNHPFKGLSPWGLSCLLHPFHGISDIASESLKIYPNFYKHGKF